MNRAKNILIVLRRANSVLSTQIRNTTRPQVTHFSQLSSLLPIQHRFSQNPIITAHKKLFYSTTPNSVAELVLANDWATELETELENSNLNWTHERVMYILKKLDKNPEKAYSFFNWVSERDGFRPNSSLYSLLLGILLNGDINIFWETLSSFTEQGFYLDDECFKAMRNEFRVKKMEKDGEAFSYFYKKMLEGDKAGPLVKQVVEAVTKSEWSDRLETQLGRLIGELPIEELSDDFVMRVIRGLRNDPWKALSFFNWIGRSRRYEHSAVTYNALLRDLGHGYTVKEFWDVIEEMKGKGFELEIDSYINISRKLQKSKALALEEAVKLYEFMMDGPYKPSLQHAYVLLRCISVLEDLSFMSRVLKKIESTGHTLTKAAYDGIHRCLTSAGKFEEAEKIVEAMKDSGAEPDNITYSQLVHGLCKAKRFEEAYEVLENMEAIGCTPDVMTWTILIKGHCKAGEVDKALICFVNMLRKNVDADGDLLEVLINGFLSQNKVCGAYELLGQMVDKGHLKPWQATYKNLIQKLLEERRLEEALKLLREMRKQNYPPYPEPFTQYIARFGTIDDAGEFFKALSVKEHPNPGAYANLFKALFKEGRHSDAKDLLFKCPPKIRKHSDICKLFGRA